MGTARRGLYCLVIASAMISSCSRQETQINVKRIPAGRDFSGFLSSYANLKANPKFENTVSYISQDPIRNVHKYVAMIVDLPVIYLATNADEKALPDRGRAALAEYFQHALSEAVEDAFPIVQSS